MLPRASNKKIEVLLLYIPLLNKRGIIFYEGMSFLLKMGLNSAHFGMNLSHCHPIEAR